MLDLQFMNSSAIIIYSFFRLKVGAEDGDNMSDSYVGYLGGAKNIVFLGEAGSGKTETSVNLALGLAREGVRKVHFFDMDQTKPLFRARDCEDDLEREGVVFHFQSQYLDAPTVASGVIETLLDAESTVLMDVGGGSHGSHMIGQFSHVLNRDDARVLYIVNPYRPWSRSLSDIEATVGRVAGAARLSKLHLVVNPNLGPDTTAQDVVEGLERFKALFPEEKPDFVCVLDRLCAEVAELVREPILPIRLNTLPEWLGGSGEVDTHK